MPSFPWSSSASPFIPLKATQRPSLTPLDPSLSSSTYIPLHTTRSPRTPSSPQRSRWLRAGLLALTVVLSSYLTVYLLPADHVLRSSLLFMDWSPTVAPLDLEMSSVKFWSPAVVPFDVSADASSGEGAVESGGVRNLTRAQLEETYRVFQPAAHVNASRAVLSVPVLGDGCLEKWLGRGEECSVDEVAEKEVELDVVWTWVNGSDPIWRQQFVHYADPSVTPLPKDWGIPPVRHYRNKDELRHSLRSVFKHMGVHGRVRKFHLVLGDWALGLDTHDVVGEWFSANESAQRKEERGREWRVGQMPEWLEASLIGVERDGIQIEIHHHGEIFRDRTATSEVEAMQYRSEALPNFNSFAIEGQLTNIEGLAPHFIYLNDDFFLTRPHSKTDWYSPLLGPVLALVFPAWVPSEEYPATACAHEWSAMLRSNWLMGHRFGNRHRWGLEHIPKVFSRPMMEEASTIWATDFAHSSRRRFREVEREESDESRVGDLHATWLSNILLVERSREAIIWSWVVARLGGTSGVWSTEARKEIEELFNVSSSTKVGAISSFDPKQRDSVVWENLSEEMQSMGVDGPETTQIKWASLDGLLPRVPEEVHGATTFNLEVCFGAFWTNQVDVSAVEMFTRLAFVHYAQCGDRLVAALVNASGKRGLSAVLPPAGVVVPISEPLSEEVQPHMPLTKTWRETDFNLHSVIRSHLDEVDLRQWVLRLLARYQFASGHSSFEFAMIHHREDMKDVLKVDEEDSTISSLAINDDIEGSEADQEASVEAIRTWLEVEWPEPGWWERDRTSAA